MRDDRDEARYVELARDFAPVVGLRRADGRDGHGAEGTLIATHWVLTAAHVARGLGPGDLARIGDRDYRIAERQLHPDWHGDADVRADIALVRLAEPVTAVEPASLYRDTDEAGQVLTLVGRGGHGSGLTGPTAEDRRLRAATNRVERADGALLSFRFDAPADPDVTDLEGVSGPGDSGGPAFLRRDGMLYVVGISSSQDSRPTGRRPGRYGVIEYYPRVSCFAAWIVQTMNRDRASP